jgi:hypothetical protein
MTTTTHAALDGTPVRFAADADLSLPMTAFGYVRPRGWRTPHPLCVFPAGQSERVRALVDLVHPEIEYTLLGEVDVGGGVLRMARVRRPVATSGHREFVYGAWEGSRSAITTAIRGERRDMEDLFDRLSFRETRIGMAVDSPVDESIRPLRCLKEVGGTLLEVRPLSPAVARAMPRRPGRPAAHGEVYRRNQTSRDVLLVTPTAAVYASPLTTSDAHVALASDIAVGWGS